MSTNPILLDMLGDILASAVVAAQAKCSDDTVMARIEASQVIISRGGADLQGGLDEAGAVSYLGTLK